jgi:hypothetical protein
LDNILDGCGNVAKIGYLGSGLGGALFGGAILLDTIGGILCPPLVVLECIALAGVGICAISGVAMAGSGVVA